MEDSLSFRNITYAVAERFAPAELVPFRRADPGRARGPVPPQSPSRFEVVLGSSALLEQSEDCQVLSVFTPGVTGRRPVMVWFHGGAFIWGGGELPWYDGDILAADQDVVVVTVTARLGVLGYLCLDADSPSPAATDQMCAIEWVHRYVDQFGGDPDNITLFGQSAGGFAIEVMLRWGVGSHVRGAILQSAFIKEDGLTYKPEGAAKRADAFRALIGRDPRSLSIAELLAAQDDFAKQAGTVEVWAPVRPEAERRIEIPLIAGLTTHDTLPFVLMENGISEPRPEHFDVFAEEVKRRNHVKISRGNYETLDEACLSGQRCWLYEFDWDVPGSGWGAPHCIELPFLLGHREAWSAAAILKGADEDVFDHRSKYLRGVWGHFAHRRNPGVGWVEYDKEARVANRLSQVSAAGVTSIGGLLSVNMKEGE